MKEYQLFSKVKAVFGQKGEKCPTDKPIMLKQIHSATSYYVHQDEVLHHQEGDGLWTDQKNLSLVVKTADCIPLLWAHPSGVIAAIHAGWRGLEQKILLHTLNSIIKQKKINLEDSVLLVGPAICANCYEVGEDVASVFRKDYANALISEPFKKIKIDLKKIIYTQAESMNIKNIIHLDDCTRCLFPQYHSRRKEISLGLEAAEGRNLSWITIED